MDLEQGPFNFLRITEEVLVRVGSGSGPENRD
jgi:hypothetical protein